MKLVLTQEVTGLGAPGDVVEVKDGFGRNYLVPRGFAVRWTRGTEKQIVSIRRAREVREIADIGQANLAKAQLEKLKVAVPAKAGPGGRLFGGVTAADVVAAVTKAGGPSLDRRRIEIGQPIKMVGAHQVQVRVHPEVTATVSLNVVKG